jgi:hypothetical protein
MSERDRTKCSACGLRTPELIGAERLADAVEVQVRTNAIDSRSAIGDALLDYREPTEDTDERLSTKARIVVLAFDSWCEADLRADGGESFELLMHAVDSLRRDSENPRTSAPDGCEGEGACHGPMSWCDTCGDTRLMCDAVHCDIHPKCDLCREVYYHIDGCGCAQSTS